VLAACHFLQNTPSHIELLARRTFAACTAKVRFVAISIDWALAEPRFYIFNVPPYESAPASGDNAAFCSPILKQD
jgi:hypothetical protein